MYGYCNINGRFTGENEARLGATDFFGIYPLIVVFIDERFST